MSSGPAPYDVVFDPAGSGYHTFRIPALLAIPDHRGGSRGQPRGQPRGRRAAAPVLLAFCEGRIESEADHGPIEIVLRRSPDGGRSWEPLQVVCRADGRTCGNPVPVHDPVSGDVVLVSVQNGAAATESELADGTATPSDVRRVYVQRSSDLGRSWTEPEEITGSVKPAGWGWYATGPGHGIALQHGRHRGRLVVPANHSRLDPHPDEAADSGRRNGGHCLLSDDGGHSWRVGFVDDNDQELINANETSVAELADGWLLFNARNYRGHGARRVQAISSDGGETLMAPYTECPEITAPDVQGSVLSPDGRLLLLTVPSQSSSRRDLATYVARMDDASGGSDGAPLPRWRRGAMINSGRSGYSDLALLGPDRVGVLFEGGEQAAHEEIRFAVRTIDELVRPPTEPAAVTDRASRQRGAPVSQSSTGSQPHKRFTGVIPPLVTPLTGAGDLDRDSLARLLDHVFDDGASGVFVLGSTGEGTSFTTGRRQELINATVQAVDGRGPVLAGVLAPSTDQVAELCRTAIDAGATALVAAAPFYVGTHPDEVERHYRVIAEATGDVPLLAYDIPSRAGSKLPADVLLRLAADGVIAGVKDSSGSLPGLRTLINGRDRLGLDSWSVLTGSEVTADLSVLLGVDGIIPGLANVDTGTFIRIIELVRAGELDKAAAEQQRILGLFEILGVPDRRRMSESSSSIGAVKAALTVLGVIDSVRPAPPLTAVDDTEIARIREILATVGVLQAAR